MEPEQDQHMTKQLYANAYYRNDEGKWFYAFNDKPVPKARDHRDEDATICMDAPELMADQMLDSYRAAEYLDIVPKTLASMLARGEMPQPQFRVANGRTPLWARPVIEHWNENRPGKGANLRNRGKKT